MYSVSYDIDANKVEPKNYGLVIEKCDTKVIQYLIGKDDAEPTIPVTGVSIRSELSNSNFEFGIENTIVSFRIENSDADTVHNGVNRGDRLTLVSDYVEGTFEKPEGFVDSEIDSAITHPTRIQYGVYIVTDIDNHSNYKDVTLCDLSCLFDTPYIDYENYYFDAYEEVCDVLAKIKELLKNDFNYLDANNHGIFSQISNAKIPRLKYTNVNGENGESVYLPAYMEQTYSIREVIEDICQITGTYCCYRVESREENNGFYFFRYPVASNHKLTKANGTTLLDDSSGNNLTTSFNDIGDIYYEKIFHLPKNKIYEESNTKPEEIELTYIANTVDAKTDIVGSGVYGINIATKNISDDMLNNIYVEYTGISYSVCTIKIAGDPRIQCGDLISFEDSDGYKRYIYVMAVQHSSDGGLMTTISCYATYKDSTTYNLVGRDINYMTSADNGANVVTQESNTYVYADDMVNISSTNMIRFAVGGSLIAEMTNDGIKQVLSVDKELEVIGYADIYGDLTYHSRLIADNNYGLYVKDTSGNAVKLCYFSSNNRTGVGSNTYPTVLMGSAVKLSSASGETVTSDKRLKKYIKDIDTSYEALFDVLKPVSYQYKAEVSGHAKGRTHIGFIAQDVKESLDSLGIDTNDFGGYVDIEMDGKELGLIYSEFIALNTHMIQKQQKIIDEQENAIKELTKRIENLEKNV